MTETQWQDRVKGLLKGELKRRGVSYKQLAEKLAELGVRTNDRNIANQLARGGFSAVFLVQCLEAIGCNSVQLHAT
jgi:3-mercaptopyruvate sulfurtransferase SseA